MRRIPWFVWVSVLGFAGFGSWATLVAGIKFRRAWWIAWSTLFTALFVVAFATNDLVADHTTGGLAILSWLGSVVVALSIREPYLELRDGEPSDWDADIAQAQARLQERKEALALAEADPALARELGVGRPDVRGARHAGVVDVNHASAEAIAGLPGLDRATGERAVTLREELHGFSGLADFGVVLDLDGNQVERLRDRAIFLPR